MAIKAPGFDGSRDDFVEGLLAWISEHGKTRYDGAVTQLEHALQTASLAVSERAGEAEIVAALLHDVGHFLVGEHAGKEGFLSEDLRHETVGADWLSNFFPAAVSEPVRYHVPAKRYLCAVDPAYRAGLSESSTRSLELQGGSMKPEECCAFEALACADAAVALRRRDDSAKVAGKEVPGLEVYREMLRSLVAPA